MFKKLLVVATLAAGLISTQASAAFVAIDWKVAGDKQIVLDTETGIEWLRLDNTKNMSFNQVYSLMGSSLSGWRFPTLDEVGNMMRTSLPSMNYVNYGTSITGVIQYRDQGFNIAKVKAVTNWRALFGHTDQERSYGLTLHDGLVYNSGSAIFPASDYLAVFHYNNGATNYLVNGLDTISPSHGIWLVNDGGVSLSSISDPFLNINNPNAPINMADVSQPAGLAAAGLVAFMLGFRRKKGIGYV